ncbi:MAG TPA: hypothetical protein VF245_06395 [Solirubrobacterales bacterium]
MKSIGAAALAMTGTMALIAFAWMPQAQASSSWISICEAAELECENPFPSVGVTFDGFAKEPKILTSLGTIECGESHLRILPLNALSLSLVGHLLELSFFSLCHLGGTSCTLTVPSNTGLFHILKTGSLSASVQSTGGMKISVKCGVLVNCTYGGEPVLEAKSSAEGVTQLIANEATLTGEGAFCPKTSKWDATYPVSEKMWIES